MLIETSLTAETHDTVLERPAQHVAEPVVRSPVVGSEIAAHEQRTARIARALDAVDALARRRRAQKLVEAVERLGAGLETTIGALDVAVDAITAMQRERAQAPVEAPPAWAPISAPLVPLTTFVAAPPTVAAPFRRTPAPRPAAPVAAVAPAPVLVQDARPVAAPAAPEREWRQAPQGLAAFVIDFPETSA